MNAKELAALLNGRQYREEITPEEVSQARADGLVVVYGASDDLMEFDGAISDEIGAYEGCIVYVDAKGPIPLWSNLDHHDKDEMREYFQREGKGRKIEAVWDSEGYSWTYCTDIPHEAFEILEGEDKYCRGIVFALSDLSSEAAG